MPKQKPNVVVFFTDQQRWDTSSLHGCPLDLTPNFDRMARHGTHLAQCTSCQPVCAPARASLQTGVYATEHGVWGNSWPISSEAVSLARLFRKEGYRTGYVGKWHMDGTGQGREQAVPEDRRLGYQDWLAANVLEFCSQPYDCVMFDENNEEVSLPGYRADAVTDAGIRFINDHQNEPFFLFVSVLEPHHQNEKYDYVPPRGYRERYTGKWLPPDLATLSGNAHKNAGGYYGCVKRCDEAFGRLLDALESLDLRGNTNVLYTSDHGCHFNTRPGMDKRSCHESAVHVPGALSGPGFDGGGMLDYPVSLIDLPPTLLKSAGIEPPEHFRGTAIQDHTPAIQEERREDGVFIQTTDEPGGRVGRSIRTARWKYGIKSVNESERDDGTAGTYQEMYLYDLRHDPYELCNLIEDGDKEERRKILWHRLLDQMLAIGEPEPEILPPEEGTGKEGGRY